MIKVKAIINCFNCYKTQNIILESIEIQGFYDPSLNYARIAWKAIGAENWKGLKKGTCCEECYEKIKKDPPKKKNLLERIFG